MNTLRKKRVIIESLFNIKYCSCTNRTFASAVVGSKITEGTSQYHEKKQRRIIYDKGGSFIDWKRIRIKAGDGGNGAVSFVHSRDHKGGPNGGDGGVGANIEITADHSFTQLAHLKHQYKAKNGGSGSQKNRHGKNASHIILKVPVGTCIHRTDMGECVTQFDLLKESETLIIAKGGEKGLGNVRFKSSTNIRPFERTEGGIGEECIVELELKSIADIGLVGFPNAGKSTLLRSISHAKPKVGDYPFTTLKPNIGVIQYADRSQLSVADIPGLIEGAHENKGLGHLFLRHIERCQCLLFVVDASNPIQALDQLKVLRNELEMYKTDLLSLHSALVANKIDLLDNADDALSQLQKHVDMPVIGVSAKYQSNIESLKDIVKSFFVI